MPIYYESRLAKLDINVEKSKLSDQVDEIVEDEEDVTQRERTKGVEPTGKLVGAAACVRLRDLVGTLKHTYRHDGRQGA